jgi:hypothetical protein
MKPLIDSIVRKLHALPQPKLHEVLNFVEFLTWQEKGGNQLDVGESTAEIDESTFEGLADQLADELARSVGTNVPLLSDYAVSCAGIYEEHP